MPDAPAPRFSRRARAGFDNISLDLMMWLPQQTLPQWQQNIEALIAVGPDHASLYLLELYPNAPLKDDMARAALVAGARRRRGRDVLVESRTARRERATRSTRSRTWRATGGCRGTTSSTGSDGEWLGFGCGAHSTRDGVRWKNVSSTEDYVDRLDPAIQRGRMPMSLVSERRVLSAAQRLEEALFTGIRLTEGLDLAGLRQRYGIDVWHRYRRRAGAVRRRRAGRAPGGPAGADPTRHAACQ